MMRSERSCGLIWVLVWVAGWGFCTGGCKKSTKVQPKEKETKRLRPKLHRGVARHLRPRPRPKPKKPKIGSRLSIAMIGEINNRRCDEVNVRGVFEPISAGEWGSMIANKRDRRYLLRAVRRNFPRWSRLRKARSGRAAYALGVGLAQLQLALLTPSWKMSKMHLLELLRFARDKKLLQPSADVALATLYKQVLANQKANDLWLLLSRLRLAVLAQLQQPKTWALGIFVLVGEALYTVHQLARLGMRRRAAKTISPWLSQLENLEFLTYEMVHCVAMTVQQEVQLKRASDALQKFQAYLNKRRGKVLSTRDFRRLWQISGRALRWL